MEKEKLKFGYRMKTAIFNLEKYSEFVNEKLSTTIKFLCLFVLIFTILQIGIDGVNTNKIIDKVSEYINNDITDFEYKENALNALGVSTAYDEENDFYFAMDTKNPELINTYRSEMKKHSIGIVFTEKDAYMYSAGKEKIYSYNQLLEGIDVESITKTNVKGYFQGEYKTKILITVMIMLFLTYYPTVLIAYVLQILAVGLAVYITGKIMGIKLSFKGSFSISTYSMILSSIFSIIYIAVTTFTDFKIVHFDLMYNIIIYIYAMFAVFMLKIDDMKQKEEIIKEVRKIEKVQEEVHKEIQDAKQEKNSKEEFQDEKEITEELEKENSEEVKEENKANIETEVVEKSETEIETDKSEDGKVIETTEDKNENPVKESSKKKSKGKKK